MAPAVDVDELRGFTHEDAESVNALGDVKLLPSCRPCLLAPGADMAHGPSAPRPLASDPPPPLRPQPAAEVPLLSSAYVFPCVLSELMVEDTSLSLDALGGLPGPLIKWFIADGSLGLEGLADVAAARGNLQARATTWLGLLEPSSTGLSLRFFEGTVRGRIVRPVGQSGFGWDPIFQPEGADKTFAQMTPEEKTRFSMQSLALDALRKAWEHG